MFKKLKNKLLLLNLSIISILMIISFLTIFIFTYKDIHRDIEGELHRISDFERKSKDLEFPKDDIDFTKDKDDELNPPPNNLLPERTVSFVVLTNNNWEIENFSSFFTMENKFIESAVQEVKSDKELIGDFSLDGNNWAYLIKSTESGYRIVFLDITSQKDVLTSLIYTFLIVALLSLLVIFFISNFLTNKSLQPVRAAFDKQKQFIADASHELKTPLAVIRTNIDALRSNDSFQTQRDSKWIHYIQSEVERMSKLTNDLLYLTQLDYVDSKALFTDFNLSESIETILIGMEATIFEKNIDLDYSVEPNLYTYGNKEQIQQVIMILLDNAIEYTPINGKINFTLSKQTQHLTLKVTNTGDGISEEHLDKIFDRFYRTDQSRERKNGRYGLGLAIAKTIVNQHSGKISVKSTLGETTIFTVKLLLANP